MQGTAWICVFGQVRMVSSYFFWVTVSKSGVRTLIRTRDSPGVSVSFFYFFTLSAFKWPGMIAESLLTALKSRISEFTAITTILHSSLAINFYADII